MDLPFTVSVECQNNQQITVLLQEIDKNKKELQREFRQESELSDRSLEGSKK